MPDSTTSIWGKGIKKPHFRDSIKGNISADIVIVGAGITGLTTAYLLSKVGKKVLVLEKDTIVSGESSHTTAFLNYVSDTDLSELIKKFGLPKGTRVWGSLQESIALLENIILEEKIDCQFERSPLYYYANSSKDYQFLEKENTLINHSGFRSQLRQDLPEPFNFAIKIENNAKFHPLKYLHALAQKIESNGGEIYENSEVINYSHHNNSHTIKTANAEINCQHLVLATHTPNNFAFEVHTRLIPSVTYVIAGELPKGKIQEGMYIDSSDPYHYFRVDREEKHDRFLLGGEDHGTGELPKSQDPHKSLEAYLQKIVPDKSYKITNRWSGEIFTSVDGLPFIGKLMFTPGNVFMGTGYAGDGMTFGTLAGQIISDQILGISNPWSRLYSTGRFKGIASFLSTNFHFLKEFFQDRISLPAKALQLPRNSGLVLRQKGKPIAVYKNQQGKIIKLSAVCTHLGCIVRWNNQNKSWDCPCHGSRFKPEGDVLSGPAHKPLPRAK